MHGRIVRDAQGNDMLSYRHAQHAGNDADVVKHVALVALLDALARKPTPLFLLDTHGGAGLYRLAAPGTGRCEWQAGIGRLWGARHAAPGDAVPAAVARWLDIVATFNDGDALQAYPGSPLIAARCLRVEDRAIACELHPRDAPLLAGHLAARTGRRPRFTCRAEDGYAVMRAVLPPPERRGLTLVDPAYELDHEGLRVHHALADALGRFGHGTFMVWYPLGGKLAVDPWVERLGRLPARKSFDIRFVRGSAHARERAGGGLAGCGLVVFNAPWQFEDDLQATLAWLAPRLDRESRVERRWLVAD